MKKLLILATIANLLNAQTPDYNLDCYAMSEKYGCFELPQQTKNIAYNAYRLIGLSKFFDTSRIVDYPWVNREFNKDRTHSEFIVTTEDGHTIKSSYFNRGKKKLIVVGPGFTNAKENMAPFVHMFLDYDLIIVNFRGLGIKDCFTLNPLYHAFRVGLETKLGTSEENDVFAVIDWARSQKQYDQVVGLGICLGAFVFAKSQAIADERQHKLFDKLILDGCWLNIRNVKERIIADPMLMLDPQRGGASPMARQIMGNEYVHKPLQSFLEYVFDMTLDTIELNQYLPKIKTPETLFFYGKDDLVISRDEFEYIWNNIGAEEKAAIINSNPHVHNHLRSKELFKLICEQFIENGIPGAFELLKNPEKLEAHLKGQLNLSQNFVDILKPNRFKEPSNKGRNLAILALLGLAAYSLRQK